MRYPTGNTATAEMARVVTPVLDPLEIQLPVAAATKRGQSHAVAGLLADRANVGADSAISHAATNDSLGRLPKDGLSFLWPGADLPLSTTPPRPTRGDDEDDPATEYPKNHKRRRVVTVGCRDAADEVQEHVFTASRCTAGIHGVRSSRPASPMHRQALRAP